MPFSQPTWSPRERGRGPEKLMLKRPFEMERDAFRDARASKNGLTASQEFAVQ